MHSQNVHCCLAYLISAFQNIEDPFQTNAEPNTRYLWSYMQYPPQWYTKSCKCIIICFDIHKNMCV